MRQRMIGITALALIVGICFFVPKAAAQSEEYPKMAPLDQYLMDKNTEIQLARSAAPASISGDATVLVLGRQGYETAIEGKNGFVCMVDRAWSAAFDWPEFWNPKVRAAACLNRQAARWILPLAFLRSKMTMAGRSKAEILATLKTAYEKKQLPGHIEEGAMCYMMSKSSYLTDQDGHNMPHLMWYTANVDAKDWGSGAEGSPVMAAPFWFFLSNNPSDMKGLTPVLVFLVGVADWSDGTPAAKL